MIGQEGKWRKVTISEARQSQDASLIYWRPEMVRASMETPDMDPAFVLEDIEEVKRR